MRLFIIPMATLLILTALSTDSQAVSTCKTATADDWPKRECLEPKTPSTAAKPEIKAPDFSYPCREERCDLTALMNRVQACALIVVQDGNTVLRQFAGPDGAANCARYKRQHRYGLASVTKSLTSILFGMLWSDPAYGSPIDLDMPARDALAGSQIRYTGPGTVRDLLQMSSRMWWGEATGQPKVKIVLDDNGRPKPGYRTMREAAQALLDRTAFKAWKSFNYSGFDTLMIGFLVESRLKAVPNLQTKTLPAALEYFVWKAADTGRRADWKADFERHSPGFCCLRADADDVAAVGQWILERFEEGGSPDVSPIARWLRASATDTVDSGQGCQFGTFRQRLRYGYQWWVLSGDGNGFTARGVGGQFIHVMPDFDTVIVQLGSWGEGWPSDKECESYFVHRRLAEYLGR